MNARSHEKIEELLAVRALGGLDTSELVELEEMMAAHGTCAECRRLEAEMNETAAMLAFTLEPEPIDPSMADRILDVERPTAAPDTSGAAPVDELAARRDRRSRRGWWAVAGVAAAAALVIASISVLRPSTEVRPNWAQQVIAFEGDEGELSMAFVPGEPGAVFWGQDLPDPGAGNIYEIWMIQDETPIRGACVEPVDGHVAAFIDADVSEAELMAVTVESSACPDAPTSDIVFQAELV